MSWARFALGCAAIFAVALALRLLYLAEWHESLLFSVPIGDAASYDAWARSIAAGDWLGGEVFYQAPLYPYLLSLVYALFGHDLGAVRALQAAMGALGCVVLALAGRLFFGPRVALGAGLLLAAYAPAVYYDGLIQKPTLAVFLVSTLLLLLGSFASRGRTIWLLPLGLALGALALTRENALVLVPLVGVWLLLGFRGQSASLRARWLGVFALGLALVLLPVALRNRALGGALLVSTAQLGPNLFIGNHEGASGRYLPLRRGRGEPRYERIDARLLAEAAEGRRLSPDEVSAHWRDRALAWAVENPGDWALLLARKWGLVWHGRELMDSDSIEAYTGESRLLGALNAVTHFGVLLPLAALGLVATRRRWRELWLLWGVIGSLALSIAAFYVMGRYRMVLVPTLALFASAGLVGLWRMARARDVRALLGAGALLAASGVASNWPLEADLDSRAGTWYGVGVALLEDGRPDEAARALERALAAWPEFSQARVQLGEVQRARGRRDAAQAEYEAALRLDPANAEAWNALGIALAESGRAFDAERHYRQALTLQPRHGQAQNNLANVLLARGRVEEAAGHYEFAAALLPENADVQSNLGTVLVRLRRYDAALAAYARALVLDPDHEVALRGRAIARHRQGAVPDR